jgi:hypothetical protein
LLGKWIPLSLIRSSSLHPVSFSQWYLSGGSSADFLLSIKDKTQADIRLELASAEAQHLRTGNARSVHEMSPSAFISSGLEIEDFQ